MKHKRAAKTLPKLTTKLAAIHTWAVYTNIRNNFSMESCYQNDRTIFCFSEAKRPVIDPPPAMLIYPLHQLKVTPRTDEPACNTSVISMFVCMKYDIGGGGKRQDGTSMDACLGGGWGVVVQRRRFNVSCRERTCRCCCKSIDRQINQ